jgi:hypothetical protein
MYFFFNLEKGFSLLRITFFVRVSSCVLAVPARPFSHKILVSQSLYSEIEIVQDVFTLHSLVGHSEVQKVQKV